MPAEDGARLDMSGRVAVVTGGGRGIGREHALLLAARGARVVVTDWGRQIDGTGQAEPVAQEVVDTIRAAGGTAVAHEADVGTPNGAGSVVERALQEWGRLDVLVNNAGATIEAPTPAHLTDEAIDLTIRTHLLGTIWTCRKAWPVMAEKGYGRIVNTSSATVLGVINSWVYPAAKGGILGFTRSLAVTGRPLGIAVNALMPMAYTRPMHSYQNAEVREWMARSFPAAAVAPMALVLAHESVPCSGEVFAIGGGRAARVAFVGSPGYQHPDTATFSPEDIVQHWGEVTDLSAAVTLRHSRDESGLYRGQAQWSGDDSTYAEWAPSGAV